MAKPTAFSVGRQYRCLPDRPDREPFNFVIIGKGFTPTQKVCFLWVDPKDRRPPPYGRASQYRTTSTYSHNHLKKYGTLLEEIVDPLAFAVGDRKYRLGVTATTDFGGYDLALTRIEAPGRETLATTGSATFFDTKTSLGLWEKKARLSTGTTVEYPVPGNRSAYEVSFELEFYAWKAWLRDVLGEEVVLPFLEQ